MNANKPVPWALWWIFASAAYFFLVAVLGQSMPAEPPVWFEYGFGFFAAVTERCFAKVIDYHGQDSIQWPLIIGNTLAYGAILATLVTVLTRKKPRHPTNT